MVHILNPELIRLRDRRWTSYLRCTWCLFCLRFTICLRQSLYTASNAIAERFSVFASKLLGHFHLHMQWCTSWPFLHYLWPEDQVEWINYKNFLTKEVFFHENDHLPTLPWVCYASWILTTVRWTSVGGADLRVQMVFNVPERICPRKLMMAPVWQLRLFSNLTLLCAQGQSCILSREPVNSFVVCFKWDCFHR